MAYLEPIDRVMEQALRRAQNDAYAASKWHGYVCFFWGLVTGLLVAYWL